MSATCTLSNEARPQHTNLWCEQFLLHAFSDWLTTDSAAAETIMLAGLGKRLWPSEVRYTVHRGWWWSPVYQGERTHVTTATALAAAATTKTTSHPKSHLGRAYHYPSRQRMHLSAVCASCAISTAVTQLQICYIYTTSVPW